MKDKKYVEEELKGFFTKIDDDIIVPTECFDKKGKRIAILFLLVVPLLGFYVGMSSGIDFIIYTPICSAVILFILILSQFGDFWIEINRQNKTITIWKSYKKKRIHEKHDFDNIEFTIEKYALGKYTSPYHIMLRPKGSKMPNPFRFSGPYTKDVAFEDIEEIHNSLEKFIRAFYNREKLNPLLIAKEKEV